MENNEGVFLDGGLKIEAETSKWRLCLHQKSPNLILKLVLCFKYSAQWNEINIVYHNCLI